jgi:hypothetical protein
MVSTVEGPWTRNETSASCQVFEFRSWALLTEQSRGSLHVFLPLTDRGVDGLVHRLTDDQYVLVQAKMRSTLVDGEVHLVVWADSIADDNVVIVAGMLVDGGVGPMCLVVPAGDFKRLANLSSDEGKPIYSMEFGMRPRSDSRWLPWLVPQERLATRFGVSVEGLEGAPEEPQPQWRSDLGFLGESEVIRRLAEAGELNLFRPFPDLETVELAVLHLTTRRVVGLQIKTVDVSRARPRATVNIRGLSFRSSPTTFFAVLGWLRDESRFNERCLLVPSEKVREFAHDDGHGHLEFEFHAKPNGPTGLDRYQIDLSELRERVARLVETV